MNPKVKVKVNLEDKTYIVKSKSLTAALGRAGLIVEALGDKGTVSFRKTKRGKHVLTISVT